MEKMNRKYRRQLEKSLGLLKAYKKMSSAEKKEIQRRKMATGKEIHLRNTQEVENQFIQQENDREARIIESLMEIGKSEKDATEHVRRLNQ